MCHGGESRATPSVSPEVAFLHARRSRPLPGAGSLVRRRSTSAVSFLRDNRARVGATPSARPRSTLRGQSQSASPGVVLVAFRRSEPTTGIDNGARRWASRRPIFDRRPGGRRWQPPHVNTAAVAFRSGQGHSMGVLARATLVTAVGGCGRD